MGQRLAGIGGNERKAEREGKEGRGWPVGRGARMGARRVNLVIPDRTMGYRLGSFLENEPTTGNTWTRGHSVGRA